MFHVKSSSSSLSQSNLCFKSSNFVRSLSTLHYNNCTNNELLDVFDSLLKNCSTIERCRRLHAQVIVSGCQRSAFLASRLISVYSQLGSFGKSQKVFDSYPVQICSNMLLWNSIVRANVGHGFYGNALKLFDKMLKLRVFADGFTFPLIVKACSFVGGVSLCERLHGHVVQMGFQDHLHTVNELLAMYAKLGQMNRACQLFDRMSVRTHISWNTMVSGYSFNHDCDGASEFFRRMKSQGFEPNSVTWTSLLSSHARCERYRECIELFGSMRSSGTQSTAESLAVVLSVCPDLAAVDLGRTIHGHLIKSGFEDYSFAKNALICMYGKCNELENAKRSFSEIKPNQKSLVSFNSLISSHAESGLCDEALEIFAQMEKTKSIEPNIITWSALISGFASNSRYEESLELFRRMQRQEGEIIKPNRVTICSLLSVCAELAALSLGRELHCHVIRGYGGDGDVLVGNALINMYAKSGDLELARLVFDRLSFRDSVSWNTMITGYGIHGHGRLALSVMARMVESGFEPDHVTHVAALSACNHSGLVREGRSVFEQIGRPQVEHYACLVDLLGRAGLVREATQTVRTMPVEPNACVRGALLSAHHTHGGGRNADVAEAEEESLETEVAGTYMVLSKMYAAEGRWEESALARGSARSKGLKKNPGLSWVQVRDRVHVFAAGQASPEEESVFRVVDGLMCIVRHKEEEQDEE